jgi:hypothetical protein
MGRPVGSVARAGIGALGLAILALVGSEAVGHRAASAEPRRLSITALSTRPDRVSGGDVLIEIRAADEAKSTKSLAVALNGRDVSGVFRRTDKGTYVGLVTGLTLGKNRLELRGAPWETADEKLDLVNYPASGPIVSGPHLQPFVCQTAEFKLPDGSVLGPTTAPDCSVPTRVQYVYLPAGGKDFKPLPSTTSLPSDVATTTTLTGVTMPFVVRVETGSMNRGIYQNVILHDPTKDPAPTPFTPPPGWNKRLIAVHGVGCPSGWYRQGGVQGVNPLNAARLGEGYALFTNTLNHPTNSCNPFLAGETTMMGKEHFIETFGVPFFTLSMGTSGGAYTSLQVADAFPGLIDGVVITATFPDALSIALSGLDAHLLMHYFGRSDLTEAQKVAIGGHSSVKALADAANQAQRTDPVPGRVDIEGYRPAVWNDAVPQSVRYHPTENPRGARPTVFDVARNIYGTDPRTGFARRPFDNVGVQYGLRALQDGVITFAQFLDLNERIGGVDHDANYAGARSVGDVDAIKRAYQGGVTLGGGGGLAAIPVFDAGAYNEADRYHYQWFHFAVRERMRKQNGDADNHLMWRGTIPPEKSWAVLERWVTNIKSDHSSKSGREKVVINKPAQAVDGCWPEAVGSEPRFIAEPQTFSARPDSECNRRLPSYGSVRQAAGGPLDGNVLKCQLKPIDLRDYGGSLSASDQERLRHVFPDGVCDWSKPGVNQVPVVTWASFGPAPENLVFDITKPTLQLTR